MSISLRVGCLSLLSAIMLTPCVAGAVDGFTSSGFSIPFSPNGTKILELTATGATKKADFTGNINATGNITALGSITATGSFSTSGNITAAGNITTVGPISSGTPRYPINLFAISGSSPDSRHGVGGYSVNGQGVTGESINQSGLYGISRNYYGIYGYSDTSIGIYGTSRDSFGVVGQSLNNIATVGVSGSNVGVYGLSTSGQGIYGVSTSNAGVEGVSTNGSAMYGHSQNGYGVVGYSTGNFGLYGASSSNHGVVGASTNGWGVFGWSQSNYGGTFSTMNASSMAISAGNGGSGCWVAIAYSSYGAVSNCYGSFASDEKLKKNISVLQSGLDTIMALKPVTFFWKQDKQNRNLVVDKTKKALNYGFVAQDVIKILPDLVGEITISRPFEGNENARSKTKTDDIETIYTLNYEGLIAPTIKAVQELAQQVKELKADNDDLRQEVEKLKSSSK